MNIFEALPDDYNEKDIKLLLGHYANKLDTNTCNIHNNYVVGLSNIFEQYEYFKHEYKGFHFKFYIKNRRLNHIMLEIAIVICFNRKHYIVICNEYRYSIIPIKNSKDAQRILHELT